MIPGVVNGNLEATVRLIVRGSGGQEQGIDAVIDTGFNGFLTLSPALVRQLGLPHLGQSRVLLANGQEELLDLYEVTLKSTIHPVANDGPVSDRCSAGRMARSR